MICILVGGSLNRIRLKTSHWQTTQNI